MKITVMDFSYVQFHHSRDLISLQVKIKFPFDTAVIWMLKIADTQDAVSQLKFTAHTFRVCLRRAGSSGASSVLAQTSPALPLLALLSTWGEQKFMAGSSSHVPLSISDSPIPTATPASIPKGQAISKACPL